MPHSGLTKTGSVRYCYWYHKTAIGDMVLANTDTDGTPSSGIYLVNANASGVVDAADMTVVGAADTD